MAGAEAAAGPDDIKPGDMDGVVHTIDFVNQDPMPNPEPSCAPGVPGCSARFEKFCAELYANPDSGNRDVPVGGRKVPLRFGKAPNGMFHSFVAVSEAKIAARDRLPAAFSAKLNARGYFDKLKRYLDSKHPSQLTIAELMAVRDLGSQASLIWEGALEELALEEVEKTHPGYHGRKALPTSWVQDYSKVKNGIHSQVYRAIWEKNPRWRQVEADFAEVKAEYLKEIADNRSLTPEEKEDWIRRIRTVEPEIPGSNPRKPDHDCATTQRNAFYRSETHRVVVCAGYFNAFEMKGVLAHELGHAVGLRPQQVEQERGSAIGKRQRAFREAICQQSAQGCPAPVRDFLEHYAEDLASLGAIKVQTPQFRECLQYHKIDRVPTSGEIRAQARGVSRKQAGWFADRGFLLQTVKPTEITEDGSEFPNSYHLNPCGISWIDPEGMAIGDYENILFYEAAAFACDGASKTPEERLGRAIETARNIHEDMLAITIPSAGKFSNSGFMTSSGYSEDSEERFGDGVGSRIVARLAKKQPAESRMAFVFSSFAQRCHPPDVSEAYPEEAQVVKTFSLEPHSEGKQRRIEMLVPELREALGCAKDFAAKECRL